MLKSAGHFILCVMSIPFPKQFQSISDLVSLLTGRGLIINDIPKAERYLVNIGYFRLSAYFYPLLQLPKTSHAYKAGSTFEQVLNIACQHFNDVFWITQGQCFYNQNYFNSSITEIDAELNKYTAKAVFTDLLKYHNFVLSKHIFKDMAIADLINYLQQTYNRDVSYSNSKQ